MHRPGFDSEPLLEQLAGRYGAVDIRGGPFAFESSYYEAEMGPGLVKFFVSFEPLLAQDRLAGVKRETNRVEEVWADSRGRVCNLDPGIVTHYSVIVATTKGYAHRVYLGEGVYAEPALLFRHGGLDTLPWSYPDYQTQPAHDFFKEVRRRLLQRAASPARA
jgi:hypothetical protein